MDIWFEHVPSDWLIETQDFFDAHDKELYALDKQFRAELTTEGKIKAINSLVAKLREYERVCEQLGEFYALRFRVYWVDTNCMGKYVETLKYLYENREELEAIEARKAAALNNLPEILLSYIINYPGVLQKNLYTAFDPCIKGEIRSLLRTWDLEQIITRVPSGCSYALYVSER